MNFGLIFFAMLALDSPEQRAIQYLAGEVPRWRAENGCYSCHNNGDGARALYRARRLGYAVPEEALKDTTAWLEKPSQWETNRGSPEFSDKKLARVSFAAALRESGIRASGAEWLTKDQGSDGAWHIDTGVEGGSPCTYGSSIATWLAMDAAPETADRAKAWLRTAPLATVADLAVAILADTGPTRASQAATLLRDWQTGDGGWGPRKGVPAEPFDTAMAMLALASRPGNEEPLRRGRAYLIATQLPPGGWPGTTRPAGGHSYAQHISTTAWAAMALFATDPERNRR